MGIHNLQEKLERADWTAGTSSIFNTANGKLFAWGTTVPSGAAGYAPGCLFIDTNGASATTLIYYNTGTKASCTFSAINVIDSADLADDIDLGASGTAGSLDIFPSTAAKGKLTISAADSAGDTTTTITNASQAAARTYTIPDAGASCNFLMSQGRYQAKSGNYTVTAGDSGSIFVQTAADAVFTLPATADGLHYTFITGLASVTTGLSVSPNASDKIQGKGITAADDKDIINSQATEAVGDMLSVVGDGSDGWWIYGMLGTWAREA